MTRLRWDFDRDNPSPDDEVASGTARVLGTIRCGPCERALFTLYATSVGEVWRTYVRADLATLEVPSSDGADVVATCRRHGQVRVAAADIAAARQNANGTFVVLVHR